MFHINCITTSLIFGLSNVKIRNHQRKGNFMVSLLNFNLDELKYIKEVLEKQELQKELDRLLAVKQSQPLLVEQYLSSRLPGFYEDYQKQCLKLLSELSFTDVSFLINRASHSPGNNYGGHFYAASELREYMRNRQYPDVIKTIDDYFNEYPEAIYYCEGLYNALNYIKTSVSTMLSQGSVETKDDLFLDFNEKKIIVTKNLKDISEHLLSLRSSVPNSRLCIGNHSLIRNADKYGECITRPQDQFISSIAFGSTLEKLKDGNYEESERLLFVPQCKMLKK